MNYKFCPKCGHKLNKIKEEKKKRLECSSCGFVFYQNPKPTVSALIIRDSKVLLGKRRVEPSKGSWDVIGGFLEIGEHPEVGVKREVKEETGLEIKIIDMLGFFLDVYGKNKEPTLNICYVAKVTSGKEKPGDDIKELKWFEISKPPEKIAFDNGKKMLEELRAWKNNK